MPDAPSYPSRRKFVSDLRRIRESRSLTLEGLHNETKIPLSVLEEFEATGLFDNPMFNRVYLRSLVRTYASYIDIPTKSMLAALDEALLNTYDGSLASQFLQDATAETPIPPAPQPVAPEEPEADTPHHGDTAPESEAPVGTAAGKDDDADEEKESEPEAADEPQAAAEPQAVAEPEIAHTDEVTQIAAPRDTVAEVASAGEEDASGTETGPADPPVVRPSEEVSASQEEPSSAKAPPEDKATEDAGARDAASVDVVQEIESLLRAGQKGQGSVSEKTADSEFLDPIPSPVEEPPPPRTHPPLLTTAEAAREGQTPGRRVQPVDVKRRAWYTQWMIIVVVVVGFAGAIWVVLLMLDRPDGVDAQQAGPAPTPAADTATTQTVTAPPRPRLALDDTLYVVLLANEKVERILIQRDDDLRRAYWIEAGVAKAYPAFDRIVFENKLDIIRLFVSGYEYPTTIRNEDGHVVITREGLQAFADTLSRPPESLPALPDTIPLYPVRGQ